MPELMPLEATDQVMMPLFSRPRVLIAEDQHHVLEALCLLLKAEGYATEPANSPAAVLDIVKRQEFDAVLMDLNYARDTTSGREGLDLLSQLQILDPTLPAVVMTAWGSVDLAVEAMHRGARDFVQKPWENARLLAILKTQIENGRVQRRAKRIEAQEDEDAAEAQHGLLPKSLPFVPGIQIAVEWKPARTVGGDYYDLLEFDETNFAFVIGDVAGKGVPAALLMSNLQATVRAFASSDTPPALLCRKLNAAIGGSIGPGRFITLFYAQFDTASRRLAYVCAGHNAPILIRCDGGVERLSEGGGVIGGFGDGKFRAAEVQLRSGDRLLLFTDGITEAKNAAGEEFTEARLAATAAGLRNVSAEQMRAEVMRSVAGHSGGPLQDDATLIVVAVQ